MKILVISQYYYPEPFRITETCETLVKRGHSVTVLTSQPNYPEGDIYEGYNNVYKVEELNGVKIYRTKIHPRKKGSIHLFLNYISFPHYSKKVLKKLDDDYEVVFINQLSPVLSALPGIRYAKKNKVKTFLYCLDLWPESLISGGITEGSIIYKFFEFVSKRIYRKVKHVLVTSKSFSVKFSKYGIESIYLPQYAEDSFQYIPNSIGEDNKFHCTFAGNIGEMQSVETIIYAANELREYKEIIFNIYGTGSNFDNIKKLRNEMNLDNVILHGRKDISQMPYVYSKSNIMLITMRKNDLLSLTLPGKVQTYLAAGKPILGAIDGETKLVIEESQAGYVCEAENYKEFSALILKAKNDTNLDKKGISGLNYYKDNFSKNSFFKKLENIFEEDNNV